MTKKVWKAWCKSHNPEGMGYWKGDNGFESALIELSNVSRTNGMCAATHFRHATEQELSSQTSSGAIKSDGGSSSYYDISIPKWLMDKLKNRTYYEGDGVAFMKTEELIEVLGSDFDEGNVLKCLIRINSLKNGVGKEGNDVNYDTNKIKYSADRIAERWCR